MPLPDLPVPVEEDVLFSTLTSLRVGGPARWLARCPDEETLVEVLARARTGDVEVFVLGGGSNLLVSDGGFDGLVVVYTDDDVTVEGGGDEVLLHAGGGAVWDDVVARAVDETLAGIECLSGIPGRVGAAPMQNIGAYGQEVAETSTSVRVVDRTTGEARILAADDCGFGYRWSHFKGPWEGRYVVTGITHRLHRRDEGTVRYPDLRRRLGMTDGGAAPPLAATREAVLAVRSSKAMVLDDPDDHDRWSAGSFFVNPVVPASEADAVRDRVRERASDDEAESMPAYPSDEGTKLSAAWLIERAGFERGYRYGEAGLSTRHTLALTNRGNATAADVVALAAHVRRGVLDAFGVALRPEPVFLGFDVLAEALLDRVAETVVLA